MSTAPPPCRLPKEHRNLKRKDPPSLEDNVAMPTSTATPAAPTKKVTPPKEKGNSPYQTRMNLIKEYGISANGKYYYMPQYNILSIIPNKMEEMGIDYLEDLSEAEMEEALSKLTMEEVDNHCQTMLVREGMFDHINKFKDEIRNADPRGPDYESSYTGICMVLVIQEQLAKVQRVLNKAIKTVKDSITGPNSIIPGVAKDAFEITYAAIYACDKIDHWRLDNEDPEECDNVAKKISKLLKDLLWFHDEELGLIDPFSRKSFLNRLRKIRRDWKGIDWISEEVTFLNRKNENGMGRSLDTPVQKTPPAKKLKQATLSVAVGKQDNDSSGVVAHLNALGDKLSLRTNTLVQLKIADASGKKSCRAVCSGSMSLKKVGQLVAFVTGHASDYEVHINRGKSVTGSYFELSLDGKNKLWLGENSLKKKAKAEGIGHVIDKPIKLVQVFQGLIVGANFGMIFETESSKRASLVWISDKGDRYSVTVQGILPSKCVYCASLPMPRVVDDDNTNNRKKTGFGKSIRRTNTILRGDRKASRASWPMATPAGKRQYEAEMAAKPVCTEDGRTRNSLEIDFLMFTPEKVRTAGPPSSF